MGYDAYRALQARRQTELLEEQTDLMRGSMRVAAGLPWTPPEKAFRAQAVKRGPDVVDGAAASPFLIALSLGITALLLWGTIAETAWLAVLLVPAAAWCWMLFVANRQRQGERGEQRAAELITDRSASPPNPSAPRSEPV